MSKLKNLVQQARDEMSVLGGDLSDRALSLLTPYRRTQFRIFVAAELLVVACVAGCVWYVASHPLESAQAKAIAGLLGIGSGGGLEIARRVWKDWSRTDLLVLLLSEATEPQVKALIDRLSKAL